jgi:hypothetical protein
MCCLGPPLLLEQCKFFIANKRVHESLARALMDGDSWLNADLTPRAGTCLSDNQHSIIYSVRYSGVCHPVYISRSYHAKRRHF